MPFRTRGEGLSGSPFAAIIATVPHDAAAPNRPLILITNDDGIASPGLIAAVRAVRPLGEPFVAAPDRQLSGAGRSFSRVPGGFIQRCPLEIDGQSVEAFQIGASPAVVVLHALIELVPRLPALLISGINFGENLGSDVTASGTIGAALQGAISGISTLAVSLQTPKHMHSQPSASVDFASAGYFTRLFASAMLSAELPFDADILKVDVPSDATCGTPWRLTRVSRCGYYAAIRPERDGLSDRMEPGLDYMEIPNPECAEPDSDIYALRVDRVVAVSPLSYDLTSRTDFAELAARLRGRMAS